MKYLQLVEQFLHSIKADNRTGETMSEQQQQQPVEGTGSIIETAATAALAVATCVEDHRHQESADDVAVANKTEDLTKVENVLGMSSLSSKEKVDVPADSSEKDDDNKAEIMGGGMGSKEDIKKSSYTDTTTDKPASIGSSSSQSTTSKHASKTTIVRSTTHDIYGRIWSKEPKYTIACPNDCGRFLATSKIAMHLEKCFGISGRKRSAPTSSDHGNKRKKHIS